MWVKLRGGGTLFPVCCSMIVGGECFQGGGGVYLYQMKYFITLKLCGNKSYLLALHCVETYLIVSSYLAEHRFWSSCNKTGVTSVQGSRLPEGLPKITALCAFFTYLEDLAARDLFRLSNLQYNAQTFCRTVSNVMYKQKIFLKNVENFCLEYNGNAIVSIVRQTVCVTNSVNSFVNTFGF